jgi:hypothetical protein
VPLDIFTYLCETGTGDYDLTNSNSYSTLEPLTLYPVASYSEFYSEKRNGCELYSYDTSKFPKRVYNKALESADTRLAGDCLKKFPYSSVEEAAM